MERKLSLHEEIDVVINKKSSDCKCNPCMCSDQTKDLYFQELKNILARFNNDYLRLNDMRIDFLMNASKSFSIG